MPPFSFYFILNNISILFNLFRRKLYHQTPKEIETSRTILRLSFTYEILGAGAPFIYFFHRGLRGLILSNPYAMITFAGLSLIGGYANNILSRKQCMTQLLSQDDSPLAFAAYTIMTGDLYTKMRKRFEKRYDLDDFRERYKNFSLSAAMEPRMVRNWDPTTQDFTPAYKKYLQLKSSMTEEDINEYREQFIWQEGIHEKELRNESIWNIEKESDLYVDIEQMTNELIKFQKHKNRMRKNDNGDDDSQSNQSFDSESTQTL